MNKIMFGINRSTKSKPVLAVGTEGATGRPEFPPAIVVRRFWRQGGIRGGLSPQNAQHGPLMRDPNDITFKDADYKV